MCTSYHMAFTEQLVAEYWKDVSRLPMTARFAEQGTPVRFSGDVFPKSVVPALCMNRKGEQTAFPMRWGFQIPGMSLVVNARTETAAEKPLFRESWRFHRCVLPASWYYEWEHYLGENGKMKTGQKYFIRPEKDAALYLCGLYRMEENLPVFTVLTREPTPELEAIHDRMPLMLPGGLVKDWISPDSDPRDLVERAVTDVIAEPWEGGRGLTGDGRTDLEGGAL